MEEESRVCQFGICEGKEGEWEPSQEGGRGMVG